MTSVPEIEGLPADCREALHAYVEAHGKKWKESLIVDFHNGRDANFKGADYRHPNYGSSLRAIRNHPKWGPALFEIINS